MLVERERGAKKLFLTASSPRDGSAWPMTWLKNTCLHVGLIVVSRAILYFNELEATRDCRSLAIKMMNRCAERHHILKFDKEESFGD